MDILKSKEILYYDSLYKQIMNEFIIIYIKI